MQSFEGVEQFNLDLKMFANELGPVARQIKSELAHAGVWKLGGLFLVQVIAICWHKMAELIKLILIYFDDLVVIVLCDLVEEFLSRRLVGFIAKHSEHTLLKRLD